MRKVCLTLPPFPQHVGLSEPCMNPLDVAEHWQKINPSKRPGEEGGEKQPSSFSFSTEPLDCILRGLSLNQNWFPALWAFYPSVSHILLVLERSHWILSWNTSCSAFPTRLQHQRPWSASWEGTSSACTRVPSPPLKAGWQDKAVAGAGFGNGWQYIPTLQTQGMRQYQDLYTSCFSPGVLSSTEIPMCTVGSGTRTCWDISLSSLLTGRLSWGASCRGWADSVCLVKGTEKTKWPWHRKESGWAQPRGSPTNSSKAFAQVTFTQCFILFVCLFCWHLLNYLTKKSILLAWLCFCWEESVSHIQRAPDSTQQLSGSWLSSDLAQSQLIRIRP